jgi:phosphoenolpyruvate synthase/pyruvate phosphate dikinase
MELVRAIAQLKKADVLIAGGKGSALGEMLQGGLPIPAGFVLLTKAFDQFFEENLLDSKIEKLLKKLSSSKSKEIEKTSKEIQKLVLAGELSTVVKKSVSKCFKMMKLKRVAVRSSATSEDGKDQAWAGQLESYLNVSERDLFDKIKACWASLFSARAIFYGLEKGPTVSKIKVAVIIQEMVKAEAAGVAFSVHPVTQDDNQIIIEAGVGLAENIVAGKVTPDNYVFEKKSGKIQRNGKILNDKQIAKLAKIIIKIENHFGFPCDIEWAYQADKFWIVQSRPITTLTNKKVPQKVWVENRNFNAYLVEESLVLLRRDKFFKQILGYTFKNGIVVKGLGDFLIKAELEQMQIAENKVLKAKFNFILKVNKLEEQIRQLLKNKNLKSAKEYEKIFKLMSEHLAYYGLAKAEAELIFMSKKTSKKEKVYIEKWRNYEERWASQDLIWKKISKQTKVPVELIRLMLIEEVLKVIKGEKIDLKEIKKRQKIWSLVQDNGVISVYLENKNPLKKAKIKIGAVRGMTAYSNGKMIIGIVGKDILVVNKTSPDMIEEVRKAKAVITDEGGILSHAAITARELKIPTIIGTKTATKVFKRGDKVQVDAEKAEAKKVSVELEIMSFDSQTKWEKWLSKNHSKSPGIWLKFFKKHSGIKSITYAEAVEEALCYGWIDSQAKSIDEKAYLQRFTPRGPKSVWSKINTEHIERLIKEGRLKEAGLKTVDAAKKDGRWAAAYSSPSKVTMPEDFKIALSGNKRAAAFYKTLNKANTYGILTRIQFARKAETRAKRIKEFIEMLERGEIA